MSEKKIHYQLSRHDAGQIICSLTICHENWKKTRDWFDGTLDDPYFQILECSNREDAADMARMYDELISTLHDQYMAQVKAE